MAVERTDGEETDTFQHVELNSASSFQVLCGFACLFLFTWSPHGSYRHICIKSNFELVQGPVETFECRLEYAQS